MLLLSTTTPKKIGEYEGKQIETTGLGKGPKKMLIYSKGESEMSMITTTVSHEKMVERLKGTGKPLGKIGSCGDLNGIKTTPVCLIRLEDGSNLTVNGDYKSNVEAVRAFTNDFLANAKTR